MSPSEPLDGPDPAHAWTAVVCIFARAKGGRFLRKDETTALIVELDGLIRERGFDVAHVESPLLEMTPFLRAIQDSVTTFDPHTGLLEAQNGQHD